MNLHEATAPYQKAHGAEERILNFKQGARMSITQKHDNGWSWGYLVNNNDEAISDVGYIPSAYVTGIL